MQRIVSQWLQLDGVAARLHKAAASTQSDVNSEHVAAAHSLASDMLLLGPGPDGQNHLHYLRSLLTRGCHPLRPAVRPVIMTIQYDTAHLACSCRGINCIMIHPDVAVRRYL